MKNTLVLIAVAFNGFRIFPLWALLCIKQYILRDEYALLFKKDLERTHMDSGELYIIIPIVRVYYIID